MSISQKFIDILANITSKSFTEEEKLNTVKNYKNLYSLAQQFIAQSINCNSNIKEFENRVLACECFNKIINSVDTTEYLLLYANPRIPRNIYI